MEVCKGVRLGLAIKIIDYLCEDPRSHWYGRIRRVTEPSREEHIIRDKVIIRSVVEVLKEKAFEGMRLRELADLLIDY